MRHATVTGQQIAALLTFVDGAFGGWEALMDEGREDTVRAAGLLEDLLTVATCHDDREQAEAVVSAARDLCQFQKARLRMVHLQRGYLVAMKGTTCEYRVATKKAVAS